MGIVGNYRRPVKIELRSSLKGRSGMSIALNRRKLIYPCRPRFATLPAPIRNFPLLQRRE